MIVIVTIATIMGAFMYVNMALSYDAYKGPLSQSY